jgi:hypothetical protein
MPAQPYRQEIVTFQNRGMVSKVDPALLQQGQYFNLIATVSLQEGNLSSRNGYERVNPGPLTDPDSGFTLSFIHTLGRLNNISPPVTIVGQLATAVRYLGAGANIYRIAAIQNPSLDHSCTPLGLGAGNFFRKWSYVPYRKSSSGFPYAYFGTPSLMLKDSLTDRLENTGPSAPGTPAVGFFYNWGIDGPVVPARAVVGPPLFGTLPVGTVNTNGVNVTWVSGTLFSAAWPRGLVITIGGTNYTIQGVQDQNHLTLEFPTNPVSQAGAAYTFPATISATDGPNSTLTNYSYVYTFRNPLTGDESNPSPLMVANNFINSIYQYNIVTMKKWGCAPQLPGDITSTSFNDPQVFTVPAGASAPTRCIVLYRAGGSFADDFYRQVAILEASDSFHHVTLDTDPNSDVTYWDSASDASIAGNPTALFDNQRPVTSTLPISFQASIQAFIAGGGANGIAVLQLTVNSGFGPGQTMLSQILRPGTILTIGQEQSQEQCVLWAITGNLQVQVWLQNAHVVGDSVSTDSVANQPCNHAALAFDSIFLAGDTNNPNILYQSKIGRPESFPVINLENNNPGSIEVGTPSNPIMAISEYDGEIICLNRENIFIVQVWNGTLQPPILTPAERGLVGQWAWCRADNAIFYLSYDGIYAWGGSQSTKLSEAIDPIFKGIAVNGIQPMSMNQIPKVPGAPDQTGVADVDLIQFFYWRNELLVLYNDVQGTPCRLRYHTVYQRWSVDYDYTFSIPRVFTTQLVEEDIGNLLLATAETSGTTTAFVNNDDTPIITGTTLASSDGWSSFSQDDGIAIPYSIFTGGYTMGAPALQKQFGDLVVEYVSPSSPINVQCFYNFGGPDPTDVFALPVSVGRSRFALPLKSGSAMEAYSMALRFYGSSISPITLCSLTFNWLPLENIQRGRALDWDDGGHPYDKRLQVLTVEADTQGQNVTLNLDIMNGIAGATETQAVQTFPLISPVSTLATGPVRSRFNFPINDGTIAKLFRLRPTVSGAPFKMWMSYKIDFFPYPADTVYFTDWTTDGYGGDKIYRELLLDVDCGGCDATVYAQIDGVTRATFIIRTTFTDRERILTMPSDIVGKMHRILVVPDPFGKFQLFSWRYTWIGEPYAVASLDSYEQTFGVQSWTFVKQLWAEYRCTSTITVQVYCDNNQLLSSTTLPAHPYRNTERFYLPAISATGILNKSKVHRFKVFPCDTCAKIYWYVDGSRVEYGVIGADQRQAYGQFPLFESIPVPAPAPASQ